MSAVELGIFCKLPSNNVSLFSGLSALHPENECMFIPTYMYNTDYITLQYFILLPFSVTKCIKYYACLARLSLLQW